MSKFKETPRMYQADEVDSEIAILTQSKDFWKKKAEEYRDELDKLDKSSNLSDNSNIAPNSSCIARASKKDCYNKKCKRKYNFYNKCCWKFMNKCEERKRSPS